jgi:hypothetical protein
MSEESRGREASDKGKLTARDGVVGAAHVAQLADIGTPLVRGAAQTVGVADAVKVAVDVAQGKDARAIDVAGAAGSVTMSAGIGGPAVQLAAQGVALGSVLDAANRTGNTAKALYEAEVPPSSAALHAIQKDNYDAHGDPRPWVTRNLAALKSIDNDIDMRHALVVIGEAGTVKSFKDELSRQDRTVSAAAALAYEAEQRGQVVKEERKATEMSAAAADKANEDRLAKSLDERMAKSELEERGWKDRDDLADVMRDLEKLASQDWQRAADLWEKYRPGDVDKPKFIDGDVAEQRKSPVKAGNAVDRDQREADRGQPEPREPEFLTPESIRKRFIQAENKYFYREEENRLAFEDKGKRLATAHNDPDVAKSMVELAQAKGWDAVKVRGSEEFKRVVWLQASLRGLEVDGFKPKDVDLAKLEELRQEKSKAAERPATNIVEQTAMRQRTAQAEESLDRGAIVDEHQRTLSGPQRQAVEALKAILRERGDSEQAVNMAADVAAARFQNNRVHVGKILSHGQAPYENNPDNASSYYVKLQTSRGEKEVWGVDLRRAIQEGAAKVGDDVALAYQGRQKVTVGVKERDAQGKVIGTSEIVVDRNAWDVNRLDKVRDEVRKELRAAADRTDARQPLVKVYDRNAPREELRPEVVRKHARSKERSR